MVKSATPAKSIPAAKQPTKSPPDPLKIFRHAEKYHWVLGHLLGAENEEHINKIDHPAMTMAAFASELYLKCLIVELTSGRNLRKLGHDLQKLFRELPPRTRKQIEQLWDAYIWESHRADTLRKAETQLNITIPRDLSSALRAGSNAFEASRYVYENSDLKFFLSDLPEMLRRVILQIHPEWAQ